MHYQSDHIADLDSVKRNPPGKAWAATILAPGAATPASKVMVKIPNISVDLAWGPCRWAPRITIGNVLQLPSGGEAALVLFDDNHIPWITVWTPYA